MLGKSSSKSSLAKINMKQSPPTCTSLSTIFIAKKTKKLKSSLSSKNDKSAPVSPRRIPKTLDLMDSSSSS